MPSIADLFATMGLDSSEFDSKLSATRVGMVTAAEDMALPLVKVKNLLKELNKELGPTAATEMMVQLTLAGKNAQDSIKGVLNTIHQMRDAEADAAKAARDFSQARDAAGKEDSAREDRRLAQKKAVNSEIAKFEADLASAYKTQADTRIASETALNESVVSFYKQQDDAARSAHTARQESINQLRQNAYALQSLGVTLVAAFAPLDAALFGAAKTFAGFDAAMTHSLSIMGDVSDKLRGDLAAASIDLSTKFAFSAKEIAASIYSIGSAGYTAEQALAVLPVTTKFAAAAFVDLDTATKLLTSSQTVLGLRSDDLGTNLSNLARVGDVLIKADTLAAGTSKQFAEALSNVGSTARQLHVPLETTVAALAVFARQGIVGAEAGTQLGIVLRDLSTKAITNSASWKKLGIDVYDSFGNFNSLTTIMGQLEKRFAGASAEQVRFDLIQSGVQQRSLRFILTMLGMGDSLGKFETSLQTAGGTMDQVATKNLDTFSKQAEILKNHIENLGIAVGGALVKELNRFVEAGGPVNTLLLGMKENFEELSPGAKSIVAQLTLLGAAGGTAAGGFALVGGQILRMAADLKTLGASMEGINALLGTGSTAASAGMIGLIGVSLVAALVAATKQWDDYKEGLDRAYQKQKEFYDLRNKANPNLASLDATPTGSGGPWTPEKPFDTKAGADVVSMYSNIKVSIEAVTKAHNDLGLSTEESEAQRAIAAKAAEKAQQAAEKEIREHEKAYRELLAAQKDAADQQAKLNKLLEDTGIRNPGWDKWAQQMEGLSVALNRGEISAEQFASGMAHIKLQMTTDMARVMEVISREAEILGNKLHDFQSKTDLRNMFAEGTAAGDLMAITLANIAKQAETMAKGPIMTLDKALKQFGITGGESGEATTKSLLALNTILEQGDYDEVELAWSKMSTQIDRLGRTDLPRATKEYGLMLDAMNRLGAPMGKRLELQAKMLDSIIREKQLSGESATAQIIALENIRIKQEALIDSTRAWGDAYVDVVRTLEDAFDSLGENIINAIFDTGNNDQLRESIQGLNKDLEEAALNWAKVQEEAALALEEIVADHEKARARIVEDAAKSLRDATISYRRYVEDAYEDLREARQKGDAKEVAEIQKNLRRRTEDYNLYVADLKAATDRKLQDDLEAQAKAEASVKQNLENQRVAYDKFVAETQASIARMTDEITNAFERMGSVLLDILKEVGKNILSILVDGALKQLKASILENVDLFGKLGKTAGGAGDIVKIPDVMPPGGDIDLPKPGGGESGSTPGAGAGAGGALGVVNAVTGVVSAAADVYGVVIWRRIEKDIGRIEVTTRGQLNEALNLRRDLWDQHNNVLLKWDDIWNELRTIVEVLRITALAGGGGGGGGADDELAQKLADAINSRPSQAGGPSETFYAPTGGSPLTNVYSNQPYVSRTDSTPDYSNAGGFPSMEGAVPAAESPYAANKLSEGPPKPTPTLYDGQLANVAQSINVNDVYGTIQGRRYNLSTESGLNDFRGAATSMMQNGLITWNEWVEVIKMANKAHTDWLLSRSGHEFAGSISGGGSSSAGYSDSTPSPIAAPSAMSQATPTPVSPAGQFAWNQPVGQDSMSGGSGTSYTQGLTVNINVPNPDGDLVAANFIDAVEKRGVRLR